MSRCVQLPAGLAGDYGQACLQHLGWAAERNAATESELSVVQAWQDSGLAALTGLPERPLACPVPLPHYADGVVLALESLLEAPRIPWLGRRLLGMRRLSHPLRRRGRISANGSCRLLSLSDGELAVNLARDEDWALLPAWLEDESVYDWAGLAAGLAGRQVSEMLERARWLGLAVASLQSPPPPESWCELLARGEPVAAIRRGPLVLDLGSLWAGPLGAQLLRLGGAEVIKIEHPQRPDGARRGPASFFQALNQGKRQVQLDFARGDDHAQLLALLDRADVVIEGFRPRVLQHFGIDAAAWLQHRPGRTWLSITGYGRHEPEANWVAFGDDAAVAGGLAELMRREHGQAVFVGDAIADPLAGMHAALAAWASYRQGGGRLLSLSMAGVVAHTISQSPAAWRSPVPASGAAPPAA